MAPSLIYPPKLVAGETQGRERVDHAAIIARVALKLVPNDCQPRVALIGHLHRIDHASIP